MRGRPPARVVSRPARERRRDDVADEGVGRPLPPLHPPELGRRVVELRQAADRLPVPVGALIVVHQLIVGDPARL
jgi:hypothetical protein